MSSTAFHFSRIEGGQFTSRRVRQLIAQLEGQSVEVMVRKRRSYRTNSANAYYWGVVVAMIGNHLRQHGLTGPHGGPITDEQVHELLAAKFLRESVLINPDTGEYVEVVKSTKTLTKSEFGDYVMMCKQWAAEDLSLQIPDPNEQLTLS